MFRNSRFAGLWSAGCFVFALAARLTPLHAQTTAWAPQRPDRGAVSTPSQFTVSTPTVNAESAIRRAQYRADRAPQFGSQAGGLAAVPVNRLPVTTAGGDRRMASSSRSIAAQYGITLSEGEQIVGQPKIVEADPMPKTPAAGGKTELLPTPDSVSGSSRRGEAVEQGPVLRGGELFHDGTIVPGEGHDHDGHLHDGEIVHDGEFSVDPGFEFTPGCANGACGPANFDEWDDPTQCPECGLYGYHRLGCRRVAWCLYNCLGPLVREWSIFSGSSGFKGPVDLGRNGNFGFNQGFNLAGPLIPFPRLGLGYQVGARFTQTNLNGNPFGSGTRSQSFLTAGIFHRASRRCGPCRDRVIFRGQSPDMEIEAFQPSGWQWGIAYDWLTDNYYTKDTLAQLRGEVGFVFSNGNELGFWGTQGLKNDTNNAFPALLLNPADQYAFYFRRTTPGGSQGRVWGGFTGQSFGIVGTDFRVPMSNRFDFTGGFNYNIPTGGQNANSQTRESWGLAMNLVFYFGRPARGIHNTPFRPLFNVADNNVLMLDQF